MGFFSALFGKSSKEEQAMSALAYCTVIDGFGESDREYFSGENNLATMNKLFFNSEITDDKISELSEECSELYKSGSAATEQKVKSSFKEVSSLDDIEIQQKLLIALAEILVYFKKNINNIGKELFMYHLSNLEKSYLTSQNWDRASFSSLLQETIEKGTEYEC